VAHLLGFGQAGVFMSALTFPAAVFPMLPDDELAELAADIKANGLIHPIVLDDTGALIDGRNRLAACRLAGVEPRFESLNGHDPVAFILSANVLRRNLNKGQQAMAVVKLFPRNNQTQEEVAEQITVSQSRIAKASVVQEYAPELAAAVMTGTRALNDAYTEAKLRKEDLQDSEEKLQRAELELAELRENASDLADLVAEE